MACWRSTLIGAVAFHGGRADAVKHRSPPREQFDEALLARPLPDGGLMLFANLSVRVTGRDWRHLALFPRPVAELLVGTEAREVHLSLSAGRWLHDEWGAPPEPAPPGVEVWAWLPQGRASSAWHGVTSSLGTLLCTSIARLGLRSRLGSRTLGPEQPTNASVHGWPQRSYYHPPLWHLHPHAPPPAWAEGAAELRHAADPREGVCTENYGSSLLLSPCTTAAGVGELLGVALQREALRTSRHSSLRLRLIWECDTHQAARRSCRPRVHLQLAWTLVLPPDDGVASSASRALPASLAARDNWLARLVGRRAGGGLHACDLAASSTFALQLPRGTRLCSDSVCPEGSGSCHASAHLPRCTGAGNDGGRAASAHEGTSGAGDSALSGMDSSSGSSAGGRAVPTAAVAPLPHAVTGMMAPHAPSPLRAPTAASDAFVCAEWRIPKPHEPPLPLMLRYHAPSRAMWLHSTPLRAQQFLAGVGDRQAALTLDLSSHADEPIAVRGTQILPRWMLPYWHSLRAIACEPLIANAVSDTMANPSGTEELACFHQPLDRVLASATFAPADAAPLPSTLASFLGLHFRDDHADIEGIGRAGEGHGELIGVGIGENGLDGEGGAHVLSWETTLPPRARLVLVMDFEKPVRHVDAMPADASRGLGVAAAAIKFRRLEEGCCVGSTWAGDGGVGGGERTGTSDACGGEGAHRPTEGKSEWWQLMFTEALVVPVPIADPSMPFNVLAITSTLIALWTGAMFNLHARDPARMEDELLCADGVTHTE